MKRYSESGYVLITTMMVMALLLSILGVYYSTTSNEIASVKFSKGTSSGFYAAEAGLNIRSEQIRQIFVGFNRPSGSSPSTTNPCQGANLGGGDYQCSNYSFNNRTVATYINENASNPVVLTIPPGERYQNLNAQEYRYTAKSTAQNNSNNLEADLELRFKSRLVPLFQFAAFYNKDLEILPGPAMTLAGPVHTNGDLYLYSNSATLTIQGQVTAAKDIYRGRKDGSVSPNCNNQPVQIYDPLSPRTLIGTCPSRTKVTSTHTAPFNNMVQFRVQEVTVPGPEVFDATPGQTYWDKADLRLVLSLNAANNPIGIEVRNPNDSNNSSASTTINACTGVAVGGKAVGTTTIYNFREAQNIRILDVDLRGTLNCLHSSSWFSTGKLLSDQSDGGLVFHFSVKGPNSSAAQSRYAVRVRNGATLSSSVGGAPAIKGLTIVSDQPAYIMGSYNSTTPKPAAIMADTINVLSNAWSDTNAAAGIGSRVASNTTIYAAWLAGTDTTGGVDGTGGQGGAYNGGLENFPRLHENWSGKTLTYRGSIVSLNKPRHATGSWAAQSYNPPSRDWNFDTSFNNAANLPPITPRFVYLKQELFVRDFGEE